MKPGRPGAPVSVAEKESAVLVDLGLSEYRATYELQVALVDRRKKGDCGDVFLVTEHPSVFTLGRRGGRENLVVSEQFLHEKKIPLVHIERGGDITYHGEGQLVLYPVIHLRERKLAVTEYVFLLEEIMIHLAAGYGVKAERDPRNHGVWVRNRKLGSVGIAVRHGISFHGLALNVNLALEPFSWVNPCGLQGVKMTSLQREAGREQVETGEVKKELRKILETLFQLDFREYPKEWLYGWMC
ncbi:lipoyl(octanoyl) transferase LipB [Desulfomarina sp.]